MCTEELAWVFRQQQLGDCSLLGVYAIKRRFCSLVKGCYNSHRSPNIHLLRSAVRFSESSVFCRYLILHDLSAALGVPVGHDHAQLVHPGSLLPVLFENPDFQAAAEDNGGVACNKAVGELNSGGTACFTERREIA